MRNQKKESPRELVKNLLKSVIFVVAVGVHCMQYQQQRNQLLKLPAISSVESAISLVEYREESFCSSNLQKSVNSHMKGESNPCSSTRISSMKCESNPCSPTRISSKFPRKRKSFGLRRMKIRIDTDSIYFIIDGPNSNYYYFESRISRKDIPIVLNTTVFKLIKTILSEIVFNVILPNLVSKVQDILDILWLILERIFMKWTLIWENITSCLRKWKKTHLSVKKKE